MAPSPLDRASLLRRLDVSRMELLLSRFSEQVEDAVRIGEAFEPPPSLKGNFDQVVFIGMGGSAIGGDVIRSLTARSASFPVSISRHYVLPPFVNSKALCIFSSYSGNTEETLSAFQQALRRGFRPLAITSGGELARLSGRHSVPCIQIPKGLPPRAALGYSVFPILKLLAKLKLSPWDASGIRETVSLLRRLSEKRYGPGVPFRANPAKQLAQLLHGRWVAVYAGTELLDSAALRFRNQIEENAKAMASHHLLPEMNHNEILGWQFPAKLVPKTACVFLRDTGDHPRIQFRIDFTRDLLRKRGVPLGEIRSQGKSRLAKIFSAIHEGDWASFYLALLYGVDPTPVPIIETLKRELGKSKR